MSELIDNSRKRINRLKELLLKLHQGQPLEEVKAELTEILGSVPYGDVITAEQELINEGMPVSEIQKYCDLHSKALKDNIDVSFTKYVPEGHPLHTLQMENKELKFRIDKLRKIFIEVMLPKEKFNPEEKLLEIRNIFNELTDIEKHYSKKENVIFPFLEKYGITGPTTVMWGKDDEVRNFIKSSMQVFSFNEKITEDTLRNYIEILFKVTADAIEEMIDKEEKILFPMCLDKFTEIDWYEIMKQSEGIGYCLYSPVVEWKPEDISGYKEIGDFSGLINLSTGSFNTEELEAVFNAIPVDLTFVDKDDKVRFFSHGAKRIFERNKAILGRQVQYCHPPSSVHIVDKIISDFRSGERSSAIFWINFQGMLVHIAYYAVRNEKGEYLGTLEVTQDIKDFKKIEGEKRLLSYD
ncbi:MAG: DUF438 domain-containing protein [Ignavibacteria bacterium]|nr:DUF438 domain-containing protein [Ignavibacteria bacterium]